MNLHQNPKGSWNIASAVVVVVVVVAVMTFSTHGPTALVDTFAVVIHYYFLVVFWLTRLVKNTNERRLHIQRSQVLQQYTQVPSIQGVTTRHHQGRCKRQIPCRTMMLSLD
jgi:uncharacterized membrane protein